MHNSHNLLKLVSILLIILAIIFTPKMLPVEQTQETIPEPVKEAKVVDQKQLKCLADNIYFEAGGESTEGKAAVARVVLNRITHGYANTPCKVVYQTTTVKQTNEDDETFWVKLCQFSWVCEGKSNPNRNSHRYQTSLQVAYNVLAYDMYKEVIPASVLFFHNLTVQPKLTYGFVKRIGNHIFYTKAKNVRRKAQQSTKVTRETHVPKTEVRGETTVES